MDTTVGGKLSEAGRCHCGGEWFRLVPPDSATSDHVLVTLDDQGMITGWFATPVCAHCETPWVPTRARLTLVE